MLIQQKWVRARITALDQVKAYDPDIIIGDVGCLPWLCLCFCQLCNLD